ncbi:prepilin peptidase [bacterium]|nr:prepilin peptidase [bacterium]
MLLSIVILAFIFIIGLVVGSFLNVVILRTVSEESIVFPGSKCPKCQTPLKWYHNIPLLSYLFLGGKCAFCKEHISIQYPIVEFLTGSVFVGLFLRFCSPFDPLFGLEVINPISWFQLLTYIFALIVSCLYIAIAGTDILEQKVADKHTYSLIGIGIFYSILISILNVIFYTKANGFPKIDLEFFLTCPILYSIAAAIIGFLVMEVLARVGILLIGTRAFGEGDSYIAGGIGAVLGALLGSSSLYSNFLPVFESLIAILLLAVVIQIIMTLPVFLKRLVDNKNWLTLSAILIFIIYSIGYIYAQQSGWFNNQVAYWSSTIVFLILGFVTCRELLFGIKEHRTSGMYLPFGPAMVIAAFIGLLLIAI